MVNYSQHFNTRSTAQTDKIPGTNQVKNSAGGFAWEVDDWTKLNRFLILGNEGGSYYASEKKMTIDNANAVLKLLQEDGKKVVDTAVEVSESGRAPKNDPALFVMAMAIKLAEDVEVRRYAGKRLNKVARTGTHLFTFAEYVKGFGSFSRNTQRAIYHWYSSKNIDQVAYQMAKYQQRNGWSHADLIRLAHLKTDKEDLNSLFRWAGAKYDKSHVESNVNVRIIEGLERAKKASSVKEIVGIIDQYNLTREMIPTQFLGEAKVMEALMYRMPLTALFRNLGNLTKLGILKDFSDNTKLVVDKITNQEHILKSRVHPIQVLSALMTYSSGRGFRGSGTWSPITAIIDALDTAFYLSFGNVKPSGKNTVLALDVSGSMTMDRIAGVPNLTPRVASAAMALITAKTESNYVIKGFSNTFIDLNISPRMRLNDVLKTVNNLPFSSTDCSLPMEWAIKNKINAEAFVVYTDSETYAGRRHPAQALRDHRQKLGVNSKLAVVGMVANNFTIADPNDAGMLDVIGFDTAAPNVISEFFSSNL